MMLEKQYVLVFNSNELEILQDIMDDASDDMSEPRTASRNFATILYEKIRDMFNEVGNS